MVYSQRFCRAGQLMVSKCMHVMGYVKNYFETIFMKALTDFLGRFFTGSLFSNLKRVPESRL
jgi:hypothetical protein